jgi:UDP-glucuronate 4-epimerase
MVRSFTFIDDIAEGVIRVLDRPATPDPAFDAKVPDPSTSNAPYRIFNIGNHQSVQLMTYIETLEQILGKKAEKRLLPMQDGDVPATSADIVELSAWTDFSPTTPVSEGVERFVKWYQAYYGV